MIYTFYANQTCLKYEIKIRFQKLQSAHVNLNHMICPAILDPFQGANYRLIACMHQALLCPMISKFFGYVFSPSPIESTERAKGLPHKLNDMNNGLKNAHRKSNTDEHNDNHTRSIHRKKNENGCDIGNNLSGDTSIKCPNNSNKKIQ